MPQGQETLTKAESSPEESSTGEGRVIAVKTAVNLDGKVTDGARKRHTVRGGCAPSKRDMPSRGSPPSPVLTDNPGGLSRFSHLAVKQRGCLPARNHRNRS